MLEAQGKWDEAVKDYRTVLAAAPNDPSAWNNLGNASAGLGKCVLALCLGRHWPALCRVHNTGLCSSSWLAGLLPSIYCFTGSGAAAASSSRRHMPSHSVHEGHAMQLASQQCLSGSKQMHLQPSSPCGCSRSSDAAPTSDVFVPGRRVNQA